MGSFQTKGSRNQEMNEKNLKKLHAQKTFWRRNSKNALCWAFYCGNDNKEVNVIAPQTMHCILCHNNPILNVNPKMQARKGLITYNTTNSIATSKKHVNSDHPNIFWSIEEEISSPSREDEKNLPKRDQMFLLIPYLVFFLLQKNLLRKMMCGKEQFYKIDSFNYQKPSSFTICRKQLV
jgi:hypothetical protein